MKRLRVFGLGSPFGDDRLGWTAVEQLRTTPPDLSGWTIEFDCLDRPGPSLIDKMAGVDAVILIDAVHSGAAPGSVFAIDRTELVRCGEGRSSHSLGVAEVLDLGERLGALPPRLGLIGVEAGAGAIEQLSTVFDEQVKVLLASSG